MNIYDIIILAVVASAFVLCLVRLIKQKRRGTCFGCTLCGNSYACSACKEANCQKAENKKSEGEK